MKHTYLLIAITLLAAILRLYRLDGIPPGVNRDEASIGITAESLMTTGKDEYGRSFPLSFESFGDWKLPLYIYTTIPFIRTIGLSELAVRLPSALSGTASVAFLYILASVLFSSPSVGLLSAAILAIMPWHIHISRVESEAIVAVMMSIAGSVAALSAFRTKSPGRLILAAVLFGLTYYTYHGNHVSTTLLLIGMFAIYKKELFSIPKWWIALLVGIGMILSILGVTVSADHTKLSGISVFGDPTVVHTMIELPRLEHNNPEHLSARILHNRVTYAAVTIFQNYLKSYGPDFLFIRGGTNNAHNINGFGNLYPVEAPLLLAGFAFLMATIRKKSSRYVLWWVAIGGVAAAITKDAPHSNRMLAVVPALAMTVALGIVYLRSLLTKRTATAFVLALILGYAACVGLYLDRYYVHFPRDEAAHWGYAYRALTPILFSSENGTKRVIMTKPEASPYAYLLFYSGYPMASYQREAARYPISRDGFTDVAGFGRFSFRAIDWGTDPETPHTLIVTDPGEIPGALSGKIIATVRLPDGTGQFAVLDTDH